MRRVYFIDFVLDHEHENEKRERIVIRERETKEEEGIGSINELFPIPPPHSLVQFQQILGFFLDFSVFLSLAFPIFLLSTRFFWRLTRKTKIRQKVHVWSAFGCWLSALKSRLSV